MSIHTDEQLEHHAEQVRLLPEEMKRARRTKTSPLYQLNYEFDRYSAAREREDRVEHNARTILSHSGALLLLAQGRADAVIAGRGGVRAGRVLR